MTNEQIAYRLQGINGLLLSLEGCLITHFDIEGRPCPAFIRELLQDAQKKVVALAQQFEPPLLKKAK